MHGIHNVTAIHVRPPVGESGPAREINAQDKTAILLELSRPEAYALPPVGAKRASAFTIPHSVHELRRLSAFCGCLACLSRRRHADTQPANFVEQRSPRDTQ